MYLKVIYKLCEGLEDKQEDCLLIGGDLKNKVIKEHRNSKFIDNRRIQAKSEIRKVN